MRAITLKRFHIVAHSYTTSFSIKIRFYKTNKIFYSRAKRKRNLQILMHEKSLPIFQ